MNWNGSAWNRKLFREKFQWLKKTLFQWTTLYTRLVCKDANTSLLCSVFFFSVATVWWRSLFTSFYTSTILLAWYCQTREKAFRCIRFIFKTIGMGIFEFECFDIEEITDDHTMTTSERKFIPVILPKGDLCNPPTRPRGACRLLFLSYLIFFQILVSRLYRGLSSRSCAWIRNRVISPPSIRQGCEVVPYTPEHFW